MEWTKQLGHGLIAALLYLGIAYIVDFVLATAIAEPSRAAFFWSHVAVSFLVSGVYFFFLPRKLHAGPLVMVIIAVAIDLFFTPAAQLAGRFGAVLVHRLLSIALPALLGGYLGVASSRR